jgi:hypothetical protein
MRPVSLVDDLADLHVLTSGRVFECSQEIQHFGIKQAGASKSAIAAWQRAIVQWVVAVLPAPRETRLHSLANRAQVVFVLQ